MHRISIWIQRSFW